MDSVRVDFHQLHDSLNINWIQAAVDDYHGTRFNQVLLNSENLNVIGISHGRWRNAGILEISSAQHMVFEAEQGTDDPNSNYFLDRPSSAPDHDTTLRVSAGSAGYMVKTPVPDNEWRYGRTHYYASLILKRAPGFPRTTPIVRVEAWCKNTTPLPTLIDSMTIYNSSFTSDSLETKTWAFTLPSPPTKPQGVSSADPNISSVSSSCVNNGEYNIDIRVYWYGYVTTWLDKVIIDDDLGRELFSGADDFSIDSTAKIFKNNYPLMKRFYLADEPPISAFQIYKYIQTKIRNAYGTDTSNGKGSAITAQPGNLIRFLREAQPHELFVDSYPVNASVPIPTAAMSASQADSLGIAPYCSDADYTEKLQHRIQGWYIDPLWHAAVGAPNNFWMIPQLHGEYFERNGKFQKPSGEIRARPPTANEITMMCNLAVAYGAKGIFPFPLGSDRVYWDATEGWADFAGVLTADTDVNGIHRNHWTNYGWFKFQNIRKLIRMGYQEKWDALAQTNAKLKVIGPTLASLTWLATKSWNTGMTTPAWDNYIWAVDSKKRGISNDTDYVETGHFKRVGTNFVYVVNRRTLINDTLDILLTLKDDTTTEWKVAVIDTNTSWMTSSDHGVLTKTFAPAEGILFEILQRGPSVPQNVSVVNSGGDRQNPHHPEISWSKNNASSPLQAISGYEIYRSTQHSGPGILVVTTTATDSIYVDTGVDAGSGGRTIYYRVKAKDVTPLHSGFSAQVSIGPGN